VTPYLAPVVVFKPNAGADWKFRASRARRVNPYVIGQRVTVRYLAYDLETADIDGESTGWGAFIIVIVMMTVCFAIAILPIVLSPPAKR
jgi:hypothetical protein